MSVCDVHEGIWNGCANLASLPSVTSLIPKSAIAIIIGVMVLSALLNFYRPKIKGWIGEWIVRRVLAKLPKEYKQWHDVYLLDSEGHTTQIDHLVASRYGIFVIETKNYKGWIFGSEKQRTWTQSIYKKKSKFQNPLHQNARHIRVLAECTGLEKTNFHNVIYFIGEATLKTELPNNVMTNGVREYIRYQNDEVFTQGQLDKFCADVDRLNLGEDKAIASRHLKSLNERRSI